MKTISLKNNTKFIVDDEDEELVNEGAWYVCQRKDYKYIVKTVVNNGLKSTIYLHRLILNDFSSDKVIHFLDGNTLNLQKENLMLVSKSVKCHMNNKIKPLTQSGGRRGISKRNNLFIVRISINRHRKYLGSFSNLSDAVQKYDNTAIQLYGLFAQVSFNV